MVIMHPFAPLPQRQLPSHLTLPMDDQLPYSLITPPSTSIPAHLLSLCPSTPVTESTSPLASPSATSLQDFMSLMSTNYLQHMLTSTTTTNRIPMAQLENSLPSDEEGVDMATFGAYDPLLGTGGGGGGGGCDLDDSSLHHFNSNSLYLSPFAYNQTASATTPSVPTAAFKHRRADSQSSSSKSSSSGDESSKLKRKRDHHDEQQDDVATTSAELKRQTHIQSEQKRRAQIKDGFEELRLQLPLANGSTSGGNNNTSTNSNNKKMSKATILINTVIYLQQLKASHQALTQELDKVQRENERLRALHGNMFGDM